jgi:NADH-quinone oxidoreductase subunit F
MKVVVGQGSCGVATGAKKTAAEFEKQIREKGLNIPVDLTGCVGTCYLEPIVDVYDEKGGLTRYVRVQPDKVTDIVEKHLIGGEAVKEQEISEADKSFIEKQKRIVLRNCGVINPENIEEYIKTGGYEAIKKAVTAMSPDEVIEEIKVSGLRGRGGAGFPTWFKWNAAKQSPGKEKFMVCNADEGDPEQLWTEASWWRSHSLIEGMIIGGYAIGASEGVIYVRAEYPLAISRLEIAMTQAREKGFLGIIYSEPASALTSGSRRCRAFVCGEETALIASLEGERGMPRLKPPFRRRRDLAETNQYQ